ncbi:MAG TPA: M14 family zinc carboxypeptidase [Gemmatimonadaceae bacterium]|nr:M14 family zinc carboxypeptidase [Gemmatimonadaceae bacterium]
MSLSLRPVVPVLLVATMFAGAAASTAAQQDTVAARDAGAYGFYDRGPYRADVPRPDALLGYAIGERNTQYAEQQEVLRAIATAAHDRVRVETFGATNERRPMRVYIVSAPENIARLDAIRADLDRLADPRGVSAAELSQLAERTPAVVWFSCSIHGNESPGFEAAMPLLYQLAASEEPATLEMLRNTIVIINASANPDGHERFAVWYNSLGVRNPDPDAMEHDEPWSIQGRFNHYRFDMNRDVLASTQREVQAMMREMLRWHPQVSADLHGMTEQFYFPPAARPVNANIGAQSAKWIDLIGGANAAAFDAHGWLYYVRDVFDLYYPGYWDTWPSLTGATGMTYETDGGGWKGIRWRRDDGTILTFRDGISKHVVAALATVAATASHRTERLRDYVSFRQRAVDEGRTRPMKRVVLVPGTDPARAEELAASLLRAGIEVRRASAPFGSTRAHGYLDGSVGPHRFDAGAYVVDLAQPQGRVARAVLELDPEDDSLFLRTQLAKFRRNLLRGESGTREGYEFYDVTAWALPVTFGVESYWTEDAPAVSGELLHLPPADTLAPPIVPRAPAAGADLGIAVDGGVQGEGPARSAYLFSPERSGARRLVYDLLAAGYRVSVATVPIEAAGRSWPRGTFVVRVIRNPGTLHHALDSLARVSGVVVTPVNTAFTREGQYGVGSEPIVALERPTIALIGDDGISQPGYGDVWWSLEQRYGIPFTPLSLGTLARADLSDFNVIILPDASPGALAARLGSGGADHIRDWVARGGTLITMGGSSAWAARGDVHLTSARVVGNGDQRDTTGLAEAERAAADSVNGAPFRSPSANNGRPAPIPGSSFEVALDRTHWLTYGTTRSRLTVMMDGSTFYTLSQSGANVAVFPDTGTLLRAGFEWPGNTERLLHGTAFLIEESEGDGHVVLFANEPMFRGWWRALDPLVLNAILLGPAF